MQKGASLSRHKTVCESIQCGYNLKSVSVDFWRVGAWCVNNKGADQTARFAGWSKHLLFLLCLLILLRVTAHYCHNYDTAAIHS